MRLAISQIVLGVLVAVFSFIVTSQAFPTQFTLPAEESGAITTVVLVYSTMPAAQICALLAFFVGLAVVGCGIAQLIKSRRVKRAKAR
jgi:uncharacterized membrane protein AbrB (regulator of aidB expression)